MAIQTPIINTNIDRQDWSGPYSQAVNDALKHSIIEGVKASHVAGQQLADYLFKKQQGENEVANKGEETAENITQAQALAADLKKQGGSVQVHVGPGGATIGTDMTGKLQMQQQKHMGDEAKRIRDVYGSSVKGLDDAVSQVESGMVGLGQGSSSGDKTAIAALTRLADGKGARLTQTQLAMMTPKSAQGSATNMLNYWSGLADSGLTDEQRRTVGELLQAHKSRLQNEYSDTLDEAKAQAPLLAPSLHQSGQLAPMLDTFGSKAQNAFKRLDTLQASPPKPASPPAQAMGGAQSGVQALLGKLFGGGAPSPAPAPASSAFPSASDIAAEIARRKAAAQQPPQGQ